MERMERKQIGRQAFDVVFWAAAIMIVASCVGLIFNASRTKGIELVYRPPTEIITDSGEVPVINVDEAKRLFDEGAVFLDARSMSEYMQGHICCSMSVPLAECSQIVPNLIQQKLTEKPVVTYCDGEACALSKYLAECLKRNGFKDVKVFYGGWPFWLKKSHPVKMGISELPKWNGEG